VLIRSGTLAVSDRFRQILISHNGYWFWTGAPCSPQRTPGFPVKFPGIDELHAAFLNESRTRIRWWRPVQEIRDHGPNMDSSNAFTPGARILALGRSLFARMAKTFEGAAPRLFGPCTLRRTWGTRPGKRASFFAPPQAPNERPSSRATPWIYWRPWVYSSSVCKCSSISGASVPSCDSSCR
jgi:hypothetical protein